MRRSQKRHVCLFAYRSARERRTRTRRRRKKRRRRDGSGGGKEASVTEGHLRTCWEAGVEDPCAWWRDTLNQPSASRGLRLVTLPTLFSVTLTKVKAGQ